MRFISFLPPAETKNKTVKDTEHLVPPKVYISHCLTLPSDIMELTRFACVLQSCGCDVILDICSDVKVNNSGGLFRWIPTNIQRADKIVVLLTPDYLSVLKQPLISVGDQSLDIGFHESVRKVHTELFHISNILYNDPQRQHKGLLIVRRDVPTGQCPSWLSDVISLEYPATLDTNDSRLRKIVCDLLCSKNTDI